MNNIDIPVSRRRKPEASVGFVNFPVLKYQNSREGGMFVRLVVMDTVGATEYSKAFLPCCGGYNQFQLDECFLGDDLLDRSYPAHDASSESWSERDARFAKCTERYFPNLDCEDQCSEQEFNKSGGVEEILKMFKRE